MMQNPMDMMASGAGAAPEGKSLPPWLQKKGTPAPAKGKTAPKPTKKVAKKPKKATKKAAKKGKGGK